MLGSTGVAVATSPLPPIEHTVHGYDISVIRSEILDKRPEIEEKCLPRNIGLCVGPYDPDVDYEWGATGFELDSNETFVTVGHDPNDHIDYGPYTIPLPNDDLYVCHSGCVLPRPLYADSNVYVVLTIYLGGTPHTVEVGDEGNETK